MNAKKFLQNFLLLLGRVMPGVVFLLLSRQADANPTGMTVQSGNATFSVNGSHLTVTVGNNTYLNWQSFNIGAGETTTFNQPSAASIVFNRINDQNPSQIYGSLQANGIVVLLNSSGFYFGPNSFVSTAGLVVSTANCTPPQNAGGMWEFNGPPPLASIVNYGQMKVGNGGSCFLIADKIENHGDIEAPGGNIGLAAGQTVQLNERADGRGLSMSVTLPGGSVDNYGTLVADAGTISLNAKVVNQDGFIQANSVRNQNGVIELVASDALNLGANSKISAQGDDSAAGSAGGDITLKSQNVFSDTAGSEISVAGGANGGNGGVVEISASVMPAIHSTVDGHAQAGATGGQLLLDPDYIVLDTSGGDSAGSGTVAAGDNPGSTLDLNVNSAFLGFSQITLQAAYDITLASGTAWSLSDSTGQSSGQLVLEAGRNIVIGSSASLFDANNWSIAMYAGVTDFANKTVVFGKGSIQLGANAFVNTSAGDISLLAGKDITVGSGAINTTGGGNISAQALKGSINTGTYAQGYVFQGADTVADGYYVDSSAGVGGISTTAGGNVNLTAGGDVISQLPGRNTTLNGATAGSGTYGPEAGDLTIVAGGNVTGNYLVANGTGKIFAGVQMDANGNPLTDVLGNYLLGNTGSAGTSSRSLALNLVKGGWNVRAAQNIFLQEVRNPNGAFNSVDPTSAAFHAFDYALSDYVNLTAGNLVQLGGPAAALPRTDRLNVPFLYPGILDISAGAGGVVLKGDTSIAAYQQLILFPSPQGSLVINTTDGGSLVGSLSPNSSGAPQLFNLIMSDSGHTQYNPPSQSAGYFGLNDHALTPVHLNSETPFELNISGSMNLLMLGVPEAADINVVGNINNCRFQGMNLSASDTTSINVGQAAKISMENAGILNSATDGGLTVGGAIYNRGAFTSVDLTSAQAGGATVPDMADLVFAYNNTTPNGTSISAAQLLASLYYNSKTKTLTYQNISGVAFSDVLNLLQNLTVAQTDAYGNPQTDAGGNPITKQVAIIDSGTATALLAAYNAAGGAVPAGTGGYTIGGGGTLAINAGSLDLGTSTGIQSKGVGLYKVGGNYVLANYFNHGANIDINLTGDLTLYSSAIATLNGGDISINAGGTVGVGSPDFTITTLGARGIYTTGHGNISVTAGGNVDVNGSRIAAYDGGNITVESLNGDVNAGTGGSGFVVVNSFTVDPVTHAVTSSSPTIPGSGILTTTFPTDRGQIVGSILVETPRGSVNASAGGIVQLPLNGNDSDLPIVEVLAGYELQDSYGNPVSAANIGGGSLVKISDDRNIDASGSGVIGQNVVLKCTGTLKGVVFSKYSISVDANTIPTLIALGKTINANANNFGPTVELIGTQKVDANGAGNPQILSQDANGGGSTFAQGTAANTTSAAASASDVAADTKADSSAAEDKLDKKKNGKGITLARKVSRVTVLLPGKD